VGRRAVGKSTLAQTIQKQLSPDKTFYFYANGATDISNMSQDVECISSDTKQYLKRVITYCEKDNHSVGPKKHICIIYDDIYDGSTSDLMIDNIRRLRKTYNITFINIIQYISSNERHMALDAIICFVGREIYSSIQRMYNYVSLQFSMPQFIKIHAAITKDEYKALVCDTRDDTSKWCNTKNIIQSINPTQQLLEKLDTFQKELDAMKALVKSITLTPSDHSDLAP
jgi:hypothetical protein